MLNLNINILIFKTKKGQIKNDLPFTPLKYNI